MPLKDSIILTQEELVSSVGVLLTDSITRWSQYPSYKILYYYSGSFGSLRDFPFEENQEKFLKASFIQGTVGKLEFANYLQILTQTDITQAARIAIHNLSNHNVAIDAEKLLLIIRNQIEKSEVVVKLPIIRAFERDDGSVLIEWIFDHFRIGFSIELTREESGWYLVTGSKLGDIFAYGGIFNKNVNNLISWLLYFVKTNHI